MSVDPNSEPVCRNAVCGFPLPGHVTQCPVCGTDAGFPNVRTCEMTREVAALEHRYRAAKRIARDNGCIEIFKRFEKAVEDSKAAICKPLGVICSIVDNDNVLYNNYYKAVYSGSRLPEPNEWDLTREAYDASIFPYYHREITFAALCLGNKGVSGYGDFCMILRSALICAKASVFETNTFNFAKAQLLKGPIDTSGYRCTWHRRAQLADAKLAAHLRLTTTDASFPALLLGTSERDGDFIEVHIYGPIHRRAIERVVRTQKGTRRADVTLIQSLKRKLKEFGALYEEVV